MQTIRHRPLILWRSIAAVALYAAALTASMFVSDVPVTAPFSFVVTVVVAWDLGAYAALGWIGLAHIVVPIVMAAVGVGPFYVFAGQRWQVVFLMAAGVLAEIVLTYLVARLRASNRQLRAALEEVKELRGFLRICAWCKSICDTNDTWVPLESYIVRQSGAKLTHGLCPTCHEEQIHRLESKQS